MPVVDGIMATEGYQETMKNFLTEINLKTVALNFEGVHILLNGVLHK